MDSNIILKTIIAHPEEFIQWTIGITAVLTAIALAAVKLHKWIERYRILRNALDEREELIDAHTKKLQILDEKYDLIISKIDNMSDILNRHIEDSKLDNQAILRDGIMRLYRHIKSFKYQYILDQDLQNYVSMFERYSQDDGNGYVHNVVDPFIRGLPVFLSDDQAQEYFETNEHI